MKILISEKQFKQLIDKVTEREMDEQEMVDPTPKSGTSYKQSGAEGYPEVTTWDEVVGSKITRGPDNQLGNTKWDDVVGRLLKRDAANQLK